MHKFWKPNEDFKEKIKEKTKQTGPIPSAEHLQKLLDIRLDTLKLEKSRWMDRETDFPQKADSCFGNIEKKKVIIFLSVPSFFLLFNPQGTNFF